MPFGGIGALVQQIRGDIGIASGRLDSFLARQWQDTLFFKTGRDKP